VTEIVAVPVTVTEPIDPVADTPVTVTGTGSPHGPSPQAPLPQPVTFATYYL
jgi:hypothetical protein